MKRGSDTKKGYRGGTGESEGGVGEGRGKDRRGIGVEKWKGKLEMNCGKK